MKLGCTKTLTARLFHLPFSFIFFFFIRKKSRIIYFLPLIMHVCETVSGNPVRDLLVTWDNSKNLSPMGKNEYTFFSHFLSVVNRYKGHGPVGDQTRSVGFPCVSNMWSVLSGIIWPEELGSFMCGLNK